MLQVTHIDVKQFYNSPFTCIAGSRQLTRYVILDIEPLDPESGRYKLAEAQVRCFCTREPLDDSHEDSHESSQPPPGAVVPF